jgi:hypothetical protein
MTVKKLVRAMVLSVPFAFPVAALAQAGGTSPNPMGSQDTSDQTKKNDQNQPAPSGTQQGQQPGQEGTQQGQQPDTQQGTQQGQQPGTQGQQPGSETPKKNY